MHADWCELMKYKRLIGELILSSVNFKDIYLKRNESGNRKSGSGETVCGVTKGGAMIKRSYEAR